MKSLAWILCVIFAFSGLAFADTTFVAAGNVSGLWEAANSPYVVRGDIRIPAHETLNIGPGVRVYFDGYFGLLDSLGTLNIFGEDGDSVVFTTDTLVHPARWRGIDLRLDLTEHPIPCIIRYAVFEFAGSETTVRTINMLGQSYEVAHSTFRYNRGNDCVVLGWGGTSITDCLFDHNQSGNGGGAAIGINGLVSGCEFRNNQARLSGGGIMAGGNFTRYENCLIHDNEAHQNGGGIASESYTFSTVSHCLISRNHADSLGGGVSILNDSCAIDHCVISDNTASRGGGGNFAAAISIRNCTIARNSVTNSASGINLIYGYASEILNSIIAYNLNGVGVVFPQSGGTYTGFSAFYENQGGDFLNASEYLGVIARVNVNGDSCDATYNLFRDPGFVNVGAGDYRLREDSHCIDAGSGADDPDGSRPDIGALYYDQSTSSANPQGAIIPSGFALHQNFPNPFNSETRIVFELPRATDVHLAVFDLLGRQVEVLLSEPMIAGSHEVTLNSNHLSSGIYIYRMQSGTFSQSRKIIVLK